MNNWKFAFLLIAGIILIGFGILTFDVIENDCTLKREDWRYRLITFTTSLIIGFGFFGLIAYTTTSTSKTLPMSLLGLILVRSAMV